MFRVNSAVCALAIVLASSTSKAQEVLPKAERPFQGKIGSTVKGLQSDRRFFCEQAYREKIALAH
jgi:hypothetical protein